MTPEVLESFIDVFVPPEITTELDGALRGVSPTWTRHRASWSLGSPDTFKFQSVRSGDDSLPVRSGYSRIQYSLVDTAFFFRERSFLIHCESGYLALTRLFNSTTAFLDSVHLSAIAKSALTRLQTPFRKTISTPTDIFCFGLVQ